MRITTQKGPDIPREFIGLFIEDINYAVDGGLYAELLENRNFESLDVYGGNGMDYYVKSDGLYAWQSTSPAVELELVQGSAVSERNPHYLRVTCGQGGCGFRNEAYDGICMRPGVACRVSFYARCVRYQGDVTIAIVRDGEILLEKTIALRPAGADGWNRWERYELELCAGQEIRGGQFTVLLSREGVVEFDWFSMIPEDAVLGIFRRDLAELLKALRPGFLRFPGGCVTEGATLANRYRFQDTLGPLEERRHNWNRWALHHSDEYDYHGPYAHYGQTQGIGFYEYFLLCEYLGAKPLPVLGVGMACQFQSHERVEPDDPRIQEYIQDYLDLIEFANGGPETRWGAVRCQMGHPEPFHLEMVGVGNEQWETAESRFFERYTLFEREIHRVYPDIKLVGTAGPELDTPRFEAAWQFYRDNAEKKNFVHVVDEHCYTSPEWFLNHCGYFDRTPRDVAVFFGEYAAHPMGWMPMNHPECNNLEGALSEAAFLTGMARNSDVVPMTCYAPLLARLGYAQWNPDLIWFDEKSAYRTPSYFVQQMFAENLGDYNIRIEDADLPSQVSYDEQSGELAVILVNASAETRSVPMRLDGGWRIKDGPVKEIILTGETLTSTNSLEEETVRPAGREIELAESYDVPPHSVAVLRIPAVREASVAG